MDTIPEPRIQILPMDMDNVEAVAELERRCFSTPWSLDSLVEALSNPMGVYYAALLDGRLAGYVGMHHIVDEGYINNIAVDECFRHRGVGGALIRALVRYAKENHLRTLTLEVRASNEAAIALYKGFDFEEVGLRKGYYTLPTEDALLLTLEL